MDKNDGKNVLIDNLYGTVEHSLSNKNNVHKLMMYIQEYFGRNSDKITAVGPIDKVFFLNSDKEAVYNAVGLTPAEIKTAIKKSNYIKDRWRIMNEPLNTAMALMLRYFTIKRMDSELDMALTYYSFYFYSTLFHKYLPFGANENVMNYTVNHLSNKYVLKQVGTVYKAIEHTAMTSHDKYSQELIEGSDGDLALYVSSLKVRLNGFLKNIKNEYTKNYKENKFVNFDQDSYEEDNFHLADSNSYAIQRIVDNALMNIHRYGVDLPIAKTTANLNQVSVNEIRNVIIAIGDKEDAKIKKLTELLLQLFLMEAGSSNKIDDVGTNKFLIECMNIYKKSNTSNKLIIEIKDILDDWLKKYSDKYRQTNREATLSNFRRAIFMYFVINTEQSV